MSTLTNHYNVAVQSRFYAFLQEDIESTEPQVLIATAEKKRETIKENKSKAKKDKRAKQIADSKKEIITEDLCKSVEPVVDISHIEEDKVAEVNDNRPDEKSMEQRGERRSERGQRARGNHRRGGREGSSVIEEKPLEDESNTRTNNDNSQRPFGNNRARNYRRERTDEREDSFNKVGYFEEQSQSGYRGGTDRRRPYSRGGRFSRGNDRVVGDEFIKRSDSGDNCDTFVDGGDRQNRGGRGRYPRQNRGSFNRYSQPNIDENNEFEHNRIGYFDENADNSDNRGIGRSRGGRGMRRGGRGDHRRPKEEEPEVNNIEEKPCDVKQEELSEDQNDNWGSVKDEINLDKLTENDHEVIVENKNGLEKSEGKKASDWCEIENDAGVVKVDQKVTMTLDEWKALKERTLREIMDNKEDIRKANDGRDVFSGMSEYRKGKGTGVGAVEDLMEDTVHEGQGHDSGHSKLKQSIPVSVRFSRSMDYNAEVSASSQSNDQGVGGGRPGGGDRMFGSRGRDSDGVGGGGGGGGGGRGRGRSRMGQDYRGGRDYGRGGRGRGSRGYQGQYGEGGGGGGGCASRRRDMCYEEGGPASATDVNINLGNEEEFPQLS